jgi:hypothetical protein
MHKRLQYSVGFYGPVSAMVQAHVVDCQITAKQSLANAIYIHLPQNFEIMLENQDKRRLHVPKRLKQHARQTAMDTQVNNLNGFSRGEIVQPLLIGEVTARFTWISRKAIAAYDNVRRWQREHLPDGVDGRLDQGNRWMNRHE